MPPDAVPMRQPEIIAHRGYSARAPENTLAALDAAVAARADAIEWDVQVAACGTPVLFHDVHLGRTTNGVGPVQRRTLEQLQALDAGSWFSPEFAGERIPSLAEALDRVRGGTGRIYCEVKGYRELEDLDRILSVVRSAALDAETVFISLDWIVLDRISSQDPEALLGFVLDDGDRLNEGLDRAVQHGRALLDVEAGLLAGTPDLPRRARAAGLELAVWTVDDPELAGRLYHRGVTRFTTNEVERLLAWKREAA